MESETKDGEFEIYKKEPHNVVGIKITCIT